MEFDLFDELRRQVGQRFDGVAGLAVIGGNADDFVIDFAVIDEFHHANDARLQVHAGRQRGVGDDERVQFVTVFVERLWDEAVVGGLGEDERLDAVKHQRADFAFPLDFVVGACRDFDNDVDDAAVHVASVEDLVEVCHGFFLCCEGEGIITGFPRVRDAG